MKKRVLIFHPHFTISGGAGTFVLEVGSRLHDLGYQVIVISIRHDHAITSSFEEKITFIDIGGPLSSSILHWISLPFFMLKVCRIARNINPEILFPQVFPANWWGFIYALGSKKPKVIWMCQEPSAFIHSEKWINAINSRLKRILARILNPVFKKLDLFLADKADYVFANSRYGAGYAAKVYGFRADKLSHVYLAADPDFSLAENAPTFDQRVSQVVTVCRLTKFKNVDFLIKLIKQVNAGSANPVKLKIIGKGEEENSLKELRDKLGLQDLVEFCGALSKEDLIKTLSESRAFALASVDEPFGLTVVEALACGTPAVVFDSAGPSEVVLDNLCGSLIPAMDSEKFGQAVKNLCSDRQLFERFSEQAKIRAKMFNWDNTTRVIAEKFQTT